MRNAPDHSPALGPPSGPPSPDDPARDDLAHDYQTLNRITIPPVVKREGGPGVKEIRRGAKEYHKMYASFVPREGYTIADQ
jgi:hypothetical protein